MKKMHVVIPMSGQGTRYQAAGYKDPKPLIKVNGIPMIERLLRSMSGDWQYHFVLAENHKNTGLVETLQKIKPTSSIHFIGPHKEGPSYAIRPFLKNIPENDPILVSYCDYGMVWDPQSFQQFVFDTNCDSCLISYRGFHAHYLSAQNYAFSRMMGERVLEVREKENFTDNRENEFASSGGYYFRTRKLLEDTIDYQMKNKLELKGEFYTSLTVQALLQMNPNAHVRIFELPGFFQWGTPQDLQDFEYWEKTYKNWNHAHGFSQLEVDQVLMPMAGFGSRFKSMTQKPKPLIELQKTPMFLKALNSLPSAKKSVFVTRKEVVESISSKPKNSEFISLNEVPEGQALTTEFGLAALNANEEILVSACDHGVVINPEKWLRFKKTASDAAIFVIRGFPGVMRKPLSYSYVQSASQGEFPAFESVSVKQPKTEKPSQEFLLVGTFWFKNKDVLQKGIQILKDKNIRVNNEIYLDAIFNELKMMNYKVNVFELDGYMNWGDPESLKEALYWEEIFGGHKLSPRLAFPGVGF